MVEVAQPDVPQSRRAVLYCPPTFHMDSTWTGSIPHGMGFSPHGFHMEWHSVHMDSTWNGVQSTWIPHGMEFSPHGFHMGGLYPPPLIPTDSYGTFFRTGLSKI